MYQVVLLIEQPLSHVDAQQIVDLHASFDDPAHILVVLPVEDASHRVESALGSIAASEVLSTSALNYPDVDPAELQREALAHSQAAIDRSVELLQRCGCQASGQVATRDPIDALVEIVRERHAEEVIILTRPHLVAEFFHVDWTSKARRHLGVPVLHMLEHRDPETPGDVPHEEPGRL